MARSKISNAKLTIHRRSFFGPIQFGPHCSRARNESPLLIALHEDKGHVAGLATSKQQFLSKNMIVTFCSASLDFRKSNFQLFPVLPFVSQMGGTMVYLITNAVAIVCDEVSCKLGATTIQKEGEEVVDEERIVFVMSTLHKDLFHPKKGVTDIALYMW
jgi:hypothetical protein